MNSETITGRYRHYKGNEYEVICEGTHTETGEKLVVYKALYEPYAIWVRPYDMFFETVVVNGETILRFQKVGE
jgi:cyclomaltodextrinase